MIPMIVLEGWHESLVFVLVLALVATVLVINSATSASGCLRTNAITIPRRSIPRSTPRRREDR
jgi:hypothetical protein